MKFSIASALHYHAFEPSTVVCSLSCFETPGQKILEEELTLSREVKRADLTVGLDGNRFTKLDIQSPGDLTVQYQAIVQNAVTRIPTASVPIGNPTAFDAIALPYLNPSRYAPADRMRIIANELFGHLEGALAQALGIEDWLYRNISYQVGASNEQSWSLHTFETRSGVCRDFAHLGITFCRALNIPARYVTVYAYQLNPQDFHAVFEVYIGGNWLLMDGTRLASLNGMVRIATGRDASETALGSLFGNIHGQGVQVSTQIANSEPLEFCPITRNTLNQGEEVLLLG